EITVCVVIFVVLAAIVGSLAVFFGMRRPHETDVSTSIFTLESSKEPACYAPACNDAEKILKNIMNENGDACTDFYDFVCGNFRFASGNMLSKLTADMHQAVHTALSQTEISQHGQSALEKAAGLYAACNNQGVSGTDDTESLKKFMDNIGLSLMTPALGEALDKIIFLGLQYDLKSVLGLTLTDHIVYKQKRQIEITLSPLQIAWLVQRQSIGEYERARIYSEFLKALSGTIPNPQTINVINNAETTAVIILQKVQQHQDTNVFLRMRMIDDYTPSMPPGRWEHLIVTHSENAYPRSNQVVSSLRALTYIDQLYAKLGDSGINVLVAWEILRQLGPLTSPSIAALYPQDTARQLCLNAVIQAMEVPALSAYLFRAVPPEAIDATNVMLKRIHVSVLQEIDESDWLDDIPRSVASRKVAGMAKHVGYPTHLSTEDDLDTFYEHYPDVQNSFLAPWLQALRINMQWLFRDQGHFVFHLTPVNAYYLPMRNIIVILASMIRPPVYVLDGPDAFNFGGLGHVLGHEMMHAFDVEGSKRDATGRLTNWWTKRTWKYYEDKTLCLRRSHQRLSRGRAATLLNPTLDSENMADFLGLSSALKAFQEQQDTRRFRSLPYNSTQLFFISSCVKWCAYPVKKDAAAYAAPRERCNVPLMNLDAFAQAFKCPRNAPMNPPNKCSFW
ncbi:unnamed protein product, partial [Ixodes hexagonus]